ncbi:MAG TPA: response regulator transcription factor [Myxococcota bacterium]|nr:response regulator transcription factor [Myxococcota bacterium]
MDPEPSSVEATRRALEAAGLEVQTAASSRDALALLQREVPDLLVLEMLLPDLSGLGLCRTIREEPRLARLPIVMLTSANAEMDRVVAFEVGVDDFVSKPFHPRELALRVQAILRRTLRSVLHGDPPSLLRFRGLSLDPQQRSAYVESKPVALTAKEFDVLATLMRHAGRVLGREQILEEVWGEQSGKTVRVVDTHVKWIRRKLGAASDSIETLRGVGYRFSDRTVENPEARVPQPSPGSIAGENPSADASGTRPLPATSQNSLSPSRSRPPV